MDTFAREEIDMRILIGADIVPTLSNQQYFEEEQMEKIVDSRLFELLKKADYRVFNLEVPLTDKSMPIEKAGPNLIASVKSVVGLKQLGINFLTLANNHILDQGEQGLWSTMEQLDKNKISYAGVGNTYAEAAKPHIVEMEGKKIGIYCCAEHPHKVIELLWCLLLIVLPIALVFSESSMNNIQSISIISAFPIGIIMIIMIAGFFKDIKKYVNEKK